MRDSLGKKIQAVLFDYEGDYEGIISVVNKIDVKESTTSTEKLNESALVYWVAGVQAGVALENTVENIVYDGELDVLCPHSQEELADGADNGKFLFHEVDEEVRVFKDVNTLTSVTSSKGAEFKNNKVIRAIDAIAMEIMDVFNNNYIASDNTEDTREALKEDISEIVTEKVTSGAIASFESSSLTIEQGSDNESAIVNLEIGVVSPLRKLYLTCIVSQS